jgi:hypothetical protein
MLLAEELLVLALDPVEGRPPLGKGDALELGLCGALLCELVLGEKVALGGDRVEVADAGPTGDELLDEVLCVVGNDAGRPRKLKGCVKALDRRLGNVRGRIAGRLVGSGVLGEERRRGAGIVPVTRYPVLDRETQRRLQGEVHGWVAAASSPIDPRLASLVALLGACRLLGTVSRDKAERRRASARARAAIEENPTARAVRAIIEEVQAAAAASAALHG